MSRVRSEQSQLAQFAPHLFRHLGSAGGRARQIARRLFVYEIAPALKGRARARLDQNALAIEHDLTAPDTVFACGGSDIENTFAAGYLAADHPEQRAAIDQLLGALGQHARGVDVFGLLTAFLFLFELERNPFLEIGDRVTADAKLDKMKGHYSFPAARTQGVQHG